MAIEINNAFMQFNSLAHNNTVLLQNKPFINKTKEQTDFFENTTPDNNKNRFLKQYLMGKVKSSNVKMTENWTITVKSPEKISAGDTKLLRDVRVNTYKARVDDMFDLLQKPEEYVSQRVSEMNISDKEKENIKKLKEKFDNYYTIELNTPEKTYNLLKLSQADTQELTSKNPELADLINKETPKLKQAANEFAAAEIKKEVLADSGETSRYGAYALVPILVILGLKAVMEQKSALKAIKENPAKYLEEQKGILKQGNPLKNFMKKGGFKEYLKEMKGGSGKRWLSVLAIAFAGSWDDDLGAVKDFFQDRDNFGNKKAIGIAIPSIIMGTLTSFVIAPLMDNMINFNRARAYVSKHAPEMKAGGDAKTKAALILGNTLLGLTFSIFSSGSSWTSEALTFLQLKKTEKALKAQKILNEEESKKASTIQNFMAYEAYSGKLNGILKSDPITGILFGSTGLLTSANPYINSAATAVCGCIETITASIKQFTMDGERKRHIDKDKEQFVKSL